MNHYVAYERALTEAEERAEADLNGDLPCPVCSVRVSLMEDPTLLYHILTRHPFSSEAAWLKERM